MDIELKRKRNREKSRLWRKRHPEQLAAYNLKYRLAHPKKMNGYLKAHINKNPVNFKLKQFERRIKRIYNLTLKEFNDLLFLQGNKCAICSREFTHIKMRHLDHNHKTNKVRKFLCAGCNRSIAGLENKEWLKKALVYLAENS